MRWQLSLLLLLFVSCSGYNRDDPKPQLNDYRTGTQGIQMGIVEGFPPASIFAGDSVPLIFHLENKGAFDVVLGQVVVHSTNGKMQVEPLQKEFTLRGKAPYFPQGEQENVEFHIRTDKEGDFTSDLIAYACYGYETKYVDNLCIDPNVGKISVAPKACEMHDLSSSGGQGAPVSVVSVKVQPLFTDDSLRLRVNVSLRNNEGGKIISSHLAECVQAAETVTNALDVDVELSNGRLVCGELQGFEKQSDSGSISCVSGPLNRQAASLSPIVVSLRYGYMTRQLVQNIKVG